MKKLILFLLFVICSISLWGCKEEEKELELLNIEIVKPEGITVYLGETYEPKGVKVYAVYEKRTKDVTSLAQFSKIDTSTVGFREVVVSYQEKEASYQVEVIRKSEEYRYQFIVKQQPTKQLYYVNDIIDYDGLELAMITDDNGETIIKLDLCAIRISLNGVPKDALDEVGVYQITFTLVHQKVTYTAYIFVEVVYGPNSNNKPKDQLIVDEKESKLSYWMNEEFDPSTLVIYIMDEQSTYKAPIDFPLCTIALFFNGIPVEGRLKEEGIYTVKVEYEGLSCTANVEVKYRKIEKKIVLDYTDAKIHFSVGETFSSYGLIIAYYEDDRLIRYVHYAYCNYTLKLNGIEQENLNLPGK